MNEKIRVAAVSYLNTIPFIYGLRSSSYLSEKIELMLMPPAECARSYRNGEADIVLMPVGAMNNNDLNYLCCNWCLGAEASVESVLLVSKSPFKELSSIYIDTESCTSALMVKMLAKHHWHIEVNFHHTINPDRLNDYILLAEEKKGVGLLLIGDKTFQIASKFEYRYDIASEWRSMTGLPAIFACWLTKDTIAEDIIKAFDEAMKYGVENIDDAITFSNRNITHKELRRVKRYLTKCISYKFDSDKRSALDLYFRYRNEIEQHC